MSAVSLHTTNTHAKCQGNISMFGWVTVKKQVKVVTLLLKAQLLAFLIIVHENKRRFFNPETKVANTGMFFVKKVKFDLSLPD